MWVNWACCNNVGHFFISLQAAILHPWENHQNILIKVDHIQHVVLHKIPNSCLSDVNSTGCDFIDYILFALEQLDLEQIPKTNNTVNMTQGF